MGNGVFTALEGAKIQNRELEIIANNLANVNSAGYKGDRLVFKEVLVEAQPMEYGYPLEWEDTPMHTNLAEKNPVLVEVVSQQTDFSQGRLKQTGGALDLAIEGEGFFQVKEGNDVFYSRDGRFTINSEGVMIHTSGGQLLDDSGEPIKLSNKPVTISANGQVSQDKANIAKIGLVRLPNEDLIKKAGHNRLAYKSAGQPPVPIEETKLIQGAVEGSNINPVIEMTKLIKVNRHFEYMTKVIKAYRDLDQRSINDVGGNR